MNIGFDAKRAYHNGTGLGHYSRTLIRSLSHYHPNHQYYLFNPRKSGRFEIEADNLHQVLPTGLLSKMFSAAWRSSWVKTDLRRLHIDLYHGLSHEIPLGIHQTGIKSTVTIHDLIHERFPDQYNPVDVKIYSRKFRYACDNAHAVIAISEQTKQDIIDFYKIPAGKIRVCYQSCNPSFGETVNIEDKKMIREKYGLPEKFFLYVGSIIERKNLLNICKAIFLLRYEMDIPLVVIGEGRKYKEKVKDYIRQNGLGRKIIFLSENSAAMQSDRFRNAKDFPAIYQSAIAMVYPSIFEGFGIPVLEALWSRLPVITSNVSCLPEAGGEGAYYVNPLNAEEIARAMKRIYMDKEFAGEMKDKGWLHAHKFTQKKCADEVMKVYEEVVNGS